MFKILILLALFAVVALSEPQNGRSRGFRGNFGRSSGFNRGFGGRGFGGRGFGGRGRVGHFGKREAEAEPEAEADAEATPEAEAEADPTYFASPAVIAPGYAAYSNAYPAVAVAPAVNAYYPYSNYLATPLVHSLGKRSAEPQFGRSFGRSGGRGFGRGGGRFFGGRGSSIRGGFSRGRGFFG